MRTFIEELGGEPLVLYRFGLAEYHRMIKLGIVEEGTPYELLDGQIVRKQRNTAGQDPLRVSTPHCTAVLLLGKLDRNFEKLGCHLATQQPISLSPSDEPSPDGAIVRGAIRDFAKRKPGAADVLCVIEVADASLNRDRGYKQRIYADSGIPVYAIVNLPDRVVEYYTEPLMGKGRYGRSVTLPPKQTVEFPAAGGKSLKVPVRRLMP
jgi:Uma2 family endonuclease